MIKSCLSLLAGAYAQHFTSFAGSYGLLLTAILGAALAFLAGGRGAAAWFTAGFALFTWHALHVVGQRLEPRFEGDSMLTQLQVVDFPRRRGEMTSFVARPVGDPRIPPRVRVSWHRVADTPVIGDVWELEVRLRRPRGNSNPGVFDYEAWLFRERIGATGYVVDGPRNRRLRAAAGGPTSRMRHHIVERLETTLDNAGAAAVLAAISVGARHGITAERWQQYSRSGTSHLMAISGLHVGLAAMSAWFLAAAVCAVLRLPGNHLKAAWLVALGVAAGYACLSGFAVPARRASLMLCLFVLSVLMTREPKPFAILAAACSLVVVLDPLATLAPGFQLSFAAVLLLLWFARRRVSVTDRAWARRSADRGLQFAAVQVFLLFGMLPLTVTNFGRVSFVAPLVNFVAVPLFSVVTVPLALAGVALAGPLAVVGDAALRSSAASIELLQWLVECAVAFPFAAVTTVSLDVAGAFCLATVTAWVLLPRGWPGRHVALLALLTLVTQKVDGPPDACVDVRMLDVGQGLAVVLRTRQRTMLYDTATAFPGGGDMATRVVLPYLAAQGIKRIDRLVVSHSDIDHAGGVAPVLAGIDVARILAGEPELLTAGAAVGCRRGQAWTWDGVAFKVLHPGADTRHGGNDASCVILVAAGDARLLLTGDIESAVEQTLLGSGGPGIVDVVFVPHHGSDTSSSIALTSAVAAEVALVSAGYRNRWGLPRPGVVRRWRDAGATVLVTAREGAVGLRLCDKAGIVHLTRNRVQRRRIWHEPPWQ